MDRSRTSGLLLVRRSSSRLVSGPVRSVYCETICWKLNDCLESKG